jgi:hypothetical protein
MVKLPKKKDAQICPSHGLQNRSTVSPPGITLKLSWQVKEQGLKGIPIRINPRFQLLHLPDQKLVRTQRHLVLQPLREEPRLKVQGAARVLEDLDLYLSALIAEEKDTWTGIPEPRPSAPNQTAERPNATKCLPRLKPGQELSWLMRSWERNLPEETPKSPLPPNVLAKEKTAIARTRLLKSGGQLQLWFHSKLISLRSSVALPSPSQDQALKPSGSLGHPNTFQSKQSPEGVDSLYEDVGCTKTTKSQLVIDMSKWKYEPGEGLAGLTPGLFLALLARATMKREVFQEYRDSTYAITNIPESPIVYKGKGDQYNFTPKRNKTNRIYKEFFGRLRLLDEVKETKKKEVRLEPQKRFDPNRNEPTAAKPSPLVPHGNKPLPIAPPHPGFPRRPSPQQEQDGQERIEDDDHETLLQIEPEPDMDAEAWGINLSWRENYPDQEDQPRQSVTPQSAYADWLTHSIPSGISEGIRSSADGLLKIASSGSDWYGAITDSNSQTPLAVQAMLQHPHRLIRQLGYRTVTTRPDNMGTRTIHVLIGVGDNGTIRQPITPVPRHELNKLTDRIRRLYIFQRVDGTFSHYDLTRRVQSLQLAQFYRRELSYYGVNADILEVGRSYLSQLLSPDTAKRYTRVYNPIPPEREEGPLEYKAWPWPDHPAQDEELDEDLYDCLFNTQDIRNYKLAAENPETITKYGYKADKDRFAYVQHPKADRDVIAVRFTIQDSTWTSSTVRTERQSVQDAYLPISKVITIDKKIAIEPPILHISQTISDPRGSKEVRQLNQAIILAYDALCGCIKTLTTACCVARGNVRMRYFNTVSERNRLGILRLIITEEVKKYNELIKYKRCSECNHHKHNFCKRENCEDATHYSTDICIQCAEKGYERVGKYHTALIDRFKSAAATLRVLWQKKDVVHGKIREPRGLLNPGTSDLDSKTYPVEGYAKQLAFFLNGITDPESEYCTIKFDESANFKELILPEYGVCCMGYMSRSLPPPSGWKVAEEEMNTFNRFRTPKEPHHLDQANFKQVRLWSKNYFHKRPTRIEQLMPSEKQEALPKLYLHFGEFESILDMMGGEVKKTAPSEGLAICIEDGRRFPFSSEEYGDGSFIYPNSITTEPTENPLPRSKGGSSWEVPRKTAGHQRTISTLYRALVGVNHDSDVFDLLPRTLGFFKKPKDPERGLLERARETGEFTLAISLDIMQPYMDHALVCKRENCEDMSKHLPLLPFGLPELGGKVRVPCLTSSFLNNAASCIRKRMFDTLRYDERIKQRMKDVTKPATFKKFLESMTYTFTHAGDMTVSTDNFPMWFAEAVLLGMKDSEIISPDEFAVGLLATGPFRAVSPTEANIQARNKLVLPTYEEIQDILGTPLRKEKKEVVGDLTVEQTLDLILKLRLEAIELQNPCNLCKNHHTMPDIPEFCDIADGPTPLPWVRGVEDYSPKLIIEERKKWQIPRKQPVDELKTFTIPYFKGIEEDWEQKQEEKISTERGFPYPKGYEEGHLFVDDEGNKWPRIRTVTEYWEHKNGQKVQMGDPRLGEILIEKSHNPGPKIQVGDKEITVRQEARKPTFFEERFLERMRPNFPATPNTLGYTSSSKGVMDWKTWYALYGHTNQPEIYPLRGTCVICGTSCAGERRILHTKEECRKTATDLMRTKDTQGIDINECIEGRVPLSRRTVRIGGTEYIYPSSYKREVENEHIIRYALDIINAGLKNTFEDEYLTRKGVQMATTISIAVLYSYNAYADDMARQGWIGVPGKPTKGVSVLCGDDSLRNGDREFILIYRAIIESLGGVWSKTKDSVGAEPRGVFTELLFRNGEQLPVPKMKTIVRPDNPHSEKLGQGWKRAISAIHSLKCPEYLKEVLQSDIIDQYPEVLDENLPTALPKECGGLGTGSLSPINQSIWTNILRIQDPIIALEAHKIFAQPLRIKVTGDISDALYHKYLSILPSDQIISLKPGKPIAAGLYPLKDAIGQLRAIISSVHSLDHHRPPTESLENASGSALTALRMHSKLLGLLRAQGLEDIWGEGRYQSGLLPKPRTDSQFIEQVLNLHVPRTWADHILGERGVEL